MLKFSAIVNRTVLAATQLPTDACPRSNKDKTPSGHRYRTHNPRYAAHRPMRIYHYCDVTSFMSIVSKKALWLNSIRKMNDHSEGLVIERAVTQHLRQIADSGKVSHSFVNSVMNVLSFNRPDLYSCCFSEERDSTAQWMNYADSGRGFAIGFEPSALWSNRVQGYPFADKVLFSPDRASQIHAMRMALTPILYCDETVMPGILNLLEQETRRSQDTQASINSVAWGTQYFGAVAKDKSFRHEQEWRLLYAPDVTIATDGAQYVTGFLQRMEWRASRYGLTPYFPYTFDPVAIREIWIGPGNPEKSDPSSRHLIKRFLEAHGLHHVEVIESQSPYRA